MKERTRQFIYLVLLHKITLLLTMNVVNFRSTCALDDDGNEDTGRKNYFEYFPDYEVEYASTVFFRCSLDEEASYFSDVERIDKIMIIFQNHPQFTSAYDLGFGIFLTYYTRKFIKEGSIRFHDRGWYVLNTSSVYPAYNSLSLLKKGVTISDCGWYICVMKGTTTSNTSGTWADVSLMKVKHNPGSTLVPSRWKMKPFQYHFVKKLQTLAEKIDKDESWKHVDRAKALEEFTFRNIRPFFYSLFLLFGLILAVILVVFFVRVFKKLKNPTSSSRRRSRRGSRLLGRLMLPDEQSSRIKFKTKNPKRPMYVESGLRLDHRSSLQL